MRDDPRGRLLAACAWPNSAISPAPSRPTKRRWRGNPSLAQARANLISLYGRTGQWAKAEAHYRRVLAIGFNQDEAHYNYGVLLGLQRRWPEAAAAYRAALAGQPAARAGAQQPRAAARGRAASWAEAMDQYRQAVAADPQLRLARYNLGRMLLAARQVEAAAAEFDKLREPQDAESPRYLYGLAVANVQAGRREQGVELAQQARQLAERSDSTSWSAAIDRDLAGLK